MVVLEVDGEDAIRVCSFLTAAVVSTRCKGEGSLPSYSSSRAVEAHGWID